MNRRREIPIGVIIGRWVMVVAAAATLVAGTVLSRSNARVGAGANQRYVCPMHPHVASAVAGDCPICHMALERARDEEQQPTTAASLTTTAEVSRRTISQTIRAPAWFSPDGTVTGILYKESLAGLVPGSKAAFFRNAEPAAAIEVSLTGDPPLPWDASTVRARFTSARPAPLKRETGWLQLDARPQQLLVVPVSAVLYSRDGAYVWIADPDGQATSRRSIAVGQTLDAGYAAAQATERLGAVVVLSGLSEGDRVIAASAFFADAEQRLRGERGPSQEVTP